jgi:hypothetical protein
LNFSTQHRSHVLGTVLDLADVEVDNAEDLDEIVKCTIKEKAPAMQARAIIAKVYTFPILLAFIYGLLLLDSSSRLPSSHNIVSANKWHRECYGYSCAAT